MPRLIRPHIPLETRCRVLLRQIFIAVALDHLFGAGDLHSSEMGVDHIIAANKGRMGAFWRELMASLAPLLGCDPSDLQLDHDPALGAREKVFDRDRAHVGYKPAANDPGYLIYREKRAHQIKTNVRGDGAQRPDRVLIKRQRKLERGPSSRPKKKIPGKPFSKIKRPFKSGSDWPKGRKIQTRKK